MWLLRRQRVGNDIWLMPAVVVNPGDTLVVSTFKRVDPEEIHKIRDAVMKQLPGVNVLVIAGADISKITN
jgi:hypothetical protein